MLTLYAVSLFSLDSYANNNVKTSVKIASMVASPNSCQLEASQEVCEMTFHIIWETPKRGNYCLHSPKSTQPLKCWYQKKRGSITLDYFAHILTPPKVYTLLDNQGDIFIASVTVPVIGTLKQRQRAQRRRRGFWRMF